MLDAKVTILLFPVLARFMTRQVRVPSVLRAGALPGVWKNDDRSVTRTSTSTRIPAATMPISDQRPEVGRVCRVLTMIQIKNPAAATGRMPASSASEGLLVMRFQ